MNEQAQLPEHRLQARLQQISNLERKLQVMKRMGRHPTTSRKIDEYTQKIKHLQAILHDPLDARHRARLLRKSPYKTFHNPPMVVNMDRAEFHRLW